MPLQRALHPRDMPARRAAEQKAGEWLKADHCRPQTRADCAEIARPCPYVGCRYHLFLEVTPRGSIKHPYGEDVAALETLPATCALDVAEDGAMDLKALAQLLELSIWGTLLILNSAYGRLALTEVVQEQGEGRALPVSRKVQAGTQGRRPKAPSERGRKIGC